MEWTDEEFNEAVRSLRDNGASKEEARKMIRDLFPPIGLPCMKLTKTVP